MYMQFRRDPLHSCHNNCMLREEMDALAGGYHADPFRVLGPHAIDGAATVRALLPQAETAGLLVNGKYAPMTRLHPGGLFEASLPQVDTHYRIRVKRFEGNEEEFEDPYRFGPQLSSFDLHLHNEGTLYRGWETLGAHCVEADGVPGVRFAVWAPNALNVTLAGDFNDWDTRRHPMRHRDGGVWELFVPGVSHGAAYKYRVKGREKDYEQLHCDPYGFHTEVPPKSASVVWSLDGYQWNDAEWMARRESEDILKRPVSVYEVHFESWMRKPGGEPHSYLEMARSLVDYVANLGYTHIELLPIMEHPYSGSWGYQVTGFFAPSSRFGTPHEFMAFVDACHQRNIGVIVDWVPGHFPKDAHGLAWFDGTALYEHADPRIGEHKEWGTNVFNYGRNEVRSFLVSNAKFWLEVFHIDGLRVDAVASMLYLDYCREPGEWLPNQHGGRENLEAIEFLKIFNAETHKIPGAFTVAEESTDFVGVSRPVYLGGLGFTMKWNMGWMHDMFAYFKKDPIHRRYWHNNITFSLLYAFNENFLLPISHDEVVHGKSSLIGKMPGDEWQKFANVRTFLAYMYGHPGKKLLFMGAEIGQYEEWNWQGELNWALLQYEYHRRLQHLVATLNKLYASQPALYEVDYSFDGFEWVDIHDVDASIISFVRRAQDPADWLLFVCNFTPVPRFHYRIGVSDPGRYAEILNTDAADFGGSNLGNMGAVTAENIQSHGRPFSLSLTLPPLAVVVFQPQRA
jgi:1,4-alpha-glucan branching enzyme